MRKPMVPCIRQNGKVKINLYLPLCQNIHNLHISLGEFHVIISL